MRITIADAVWRDGTSHLTLGDVISHISVGHYRLTADSNGDWVISLFLPTGGVSLISTGSVPDKDPGESAERLLARAKSSCEIALSLHLAGSDQRTSKSGVTTRKTS